MQLRHLHTCSQTLDEQQYQSERATALSKLRRVDRATISALETELENHRAQVQQLQEHGSQLVQIEVHRQFQMLDAQFNAAVQEEALKQSAIGSGKQVPVADDDDDEQDEDEEMADIEAALTTLVSYL
jgi:hypothetical protein